MDPVAQALLTTSLTIFGGVVVFVSGHVFSNLFLDPVAHLRALIGEISNDLIFYSNVYTNPGTGPEERRIECARILRERASQLSAYVQLIPLYRICALLGLVPSLRDIVAARGGLIFLSNSTHNGQPRENDQRRVEIQAALGVPDELR